MKYLTLTSLLFAIVLASCASEPASDDEACTDKHGYAFDAENECRLTAEPEVLVGCFPDDGLSAEDCWLSPDGDVVLLTDKSFDGQPPREGWTQCNYREGDLPVCE